MNYRRILILLSLMLVPFLFFGKSSDYKYDHNSKINAMDYSLAKKVIVTGAEDGSLLVRNKDDYTILSRLQIESLPIQEIALNPKDSTCAVLQSTGDTFILSVWDLNSNTRLYNYRLLERPLFIDFSPSGNYLVFGTLRVNSLTIIDARTGKKMPWLANVNSIIQAQTMNPSDRVLLAYLASGEINYFDVRSGKIIRTLQTLPNLETPQFVIQDNILLIIGTLRGKICVINTNNGKQINSVSAPGVIKVVPSTPIGELVYSAYQDGYTFMYHWNFLKKNSTPKNLATNRNFSDTSSFIFYESKVLCGLSNGAMTEFSPNSGAIKEINPNRLKLFTGFFATEDQLTLASDNQFYTIPIANLLEGKNDFTSKANPFKIATGLTPYNEKQFFAFNKEGDKGQLYLISTEANGSDTLIFETQSPIKNFKKAPKAFLGLTYDGTSFMIHPTKLEKMFNYRASGTTDNEIVNNNRLLTAKTRDPFFKTSLIFINAETKETVPLPSSDLITFDLSYTDELATLYTIGIENKGGRVRTVLKAYRGQNFDICQPLYSISGEDHHAALLYDPYTSNLYTTMGNKGISILQWGGFTTSQWTGHTPIQLGVNQKLIFSINNDGTFTAWHKNNGKEAFTLYLFEDQIVNDLQ